MFVALTDYREPLPTDNPVLPAHWAYLDDCYHRGMLVCSGPQNPRADGVLVLCGSDRVRAEALMDADPLVSSGRVAYRLIEFTPTRAMHPDLLEAPPEG
jgi:uncharacterized protein YciI